MNVLAWISTEKLMHIAAILASLAAIAYYVTAAFIKWKSIKKDDEDEESIEK